MRRRALVQITVIALTVLGGALAQAQRPEGRDTGGAPAAEMGQGINALRDCRRAAADATGAPWIIESSAERCERARDQAPQGPDDFKSSSGLCWDDLWRAIAEMRQAQRFYEQARRARSPEQQRLAAEGRRHHAAANDAISQADRCIARLAQLLAQLIRELRGRGRRERPRTMPEERPSPSPWPSDPWGFPPAAAAEDRCQERSLGLRQARPIDRLDGGFSAGPAQPQQLQSNHPEVLTGLPPLGGGERGGIALSTLSPRGKGHPEAHLDHAFVGRFRVLASHQNRTGAAAYQVLALHNPSDVPVAVTVDALASTTTGEAPFLDLGGRRFPPLGPNPGARTANGPGDRTASRVLLGERESGPSALSVPPHATVVLHTALHPARAELVTQAELRSDGPVQAAVVYLLAAPAPGDVERVLSLGARVPPNPEDRPPPGPSSSIFGRVAGVVERSTFTARMTNDLEHRRFLTVSGCERRFAFNTKRGVDLGTGVDQAAPLALDRDGNPLRYADAAYASHGNYGAEFILRAELHNPTRRPARTRIYLDTPAEVGGSATRALRNTFRVDVDGGPGGYWYANQRIGTTSPDPFADVTLAPGQSRSVNIRLFYAADNTPPHVFRLVTD